MRIAIAKIDKKGRLHIDKVYNSQNSCKLTFVNPVNKENQNDDRK